MSVASLILFGALASATTADSGSNPDPAALVAKLGSAEPAERAAAARSLETLGREALPALQKAVEADDVELRERAAALWESIQRDLMTRPTLVRLHARDRPRDEVLKDLETQTGLALEDSRSGRQEPPVVDEPAPVPFWTAVERLGWRGVYQHGPRRNTFPKLQFQKDPVWAFTSTAGPFRVSLTGLHLHRDRQLIRGPWVRVDRLGQRINVPSEDLKGEEVTFFGGLDVMVEPRVWFTQEAPARLIEASDDLGRSLVPEGDVAARFHGGAHFTAYSGSGVTQATSEFRLRVWGDAARTARLRGVVPLMLHQRRPTPALVVPLADAAGKTFRCDDAEFTIERVQNSPTSTLVWLTARPNLDKTDLPGGADAPPELIVSRMRVMGEHQLQLTAADGTVLADSISSGGGSGAPPFQFRWILDASPIGGATHLRYFSMIRVPAEAAFDFRDVPLP